MERQSPQTQPSKPHAEPRPCSMRLEELSPPTLEEDSQERNEQQTRLDIIAGLHRERPSTKLQGYLQRLEKGSDKVGDNGATIWDHELFVEGMSRFAELLGSRRSEYYDNPLKGLHYPHTFLNQWAQSYFEMPAPRWLDEFRWQCPPGWFSKIVGLRNAWVLFYNGTKPLSQALNSLILRPTTVDCGMCSTLVVWFGIRYVLGDYWFDRLFPFETSYFVLTQSWQERMKFPVGNLLYDFYGTNESADSKPKVEPSIQIRTVYNHSLYLVKHPGGADRLQNIVQFGATCIVFDPFGSSILSPDELDLGLLAAYNEPQTPADLEEVENFNKRPEHFDDRRGLSWEILAKKAAALANHTLTKFEWDESHKERTERARHLCRVFKIERLIECAIAIREVSLEGENVEGEIFSGAKRMKQKEQMQWITSLWK